MNLEHPVVFQERNDQRYGRPIQGRQNLCKIAPLSKFGNGRASPCIDVDVNDSRFEQFQMA